MQKRVQRDAVDALDARVGREEVPALEEGEDLEPHVEGKRRCVSRRALRVQAQPEQQQRQQNRAPRRRRQEAVRVGMAQRGAEHVEGEGRGAACAAMPPPSRVDEQLGLSR